VQTIHAAWLVHGHLTADRVVLTAEGVVQLLGLGEPAWLRDPADDAPPAADDDSPAADLAALGRLAAAWLDLAPRAGKKGKTLPLALQAILDRLAAVDPERRYASASALLDDLDRAGAEVPANAEAWDRLLRHVRDALATDAPQRQSA
jgi:hypothetical protein